MSEGIGGNRAVTAISDELATSALAKLPISIVLTNPHLPDNPIIYVNPAFERMTGYSAADALGRNCRFLQGPETDPASAAEIRAAIADECDVTVDILNYRANGTPFLNRLAVTPIRDSSTRLQCFLAVQRDVSGELLSQGQNAVSPPAAETAIGEMQHRVKNHLAMIVGMIRMQARSSTGAAAFDALARRIESLQLLYQEMTDRQSSGRRSERMPVCAYIDRIASTVSHLDGRGSIRVDVECDPIEVGIDRAARIGLLFSELLTNALKHAFCGREEGLVRVRLVARPSGAMRLIVTDDGIGLPEGSRWPHANGQKAPQASVVSEGEAQSTSMTSSGGKGGLGGRIVVSLIRALDAKLDISSQTGGTTVIVEIPPEG
ncbi:PAS domain-containing protein [Mangrovicella endophytica]|uniref:PAS domain-containing protein n=1 Tax=Mangrovicella endophytica TaxID=2066697 RepID=UPI000C9DD24B|nr:PAS domain-containing protein [Mangrovicella endophytica]